MSSTYLVFATIDKFKAGSIHLSTGHQVEVTAEDVVDSDGNARLERDKTYMFRIRQCQKGMLWWKTKYFVYIDSRFVPAVTEAKLDLLYKQVKAETKKCITIMEKLDAADRCAVLRVVGIGVSGLVTAGSIASMAWNVIEIAEGGPINPTWWVGQTAIFLGSATLGLIQYEQLRSDLKKRVDIIRSQQKAQTAFTSLMLKCMPRGSVNDEVLLPEVISLISDLRVVFDVSVDNAKSFWRNNMQVYKNYVPQEV